MITKNSPFSGSCIKESHSRVKHEIESPSNGNVGRRSFLKGLGMAGATLLPASALLITEAKAQQSEDRDGQRRLSKGDAAILRFLAAAEIIESDLWEQYWELGGVQSNEFAAALQPFGNAPYTAALTILDGDQPQYITDNTDDEFSHMQFLNAYLVSRGASPVNLDPFRTIPGSQATGAKKSKLRLTNLMQLNVDTSFWARYRDDLHNPDLDPNFSFPQAVPPNGKGIVNRTAIPRDDEDTKGSTVVFLPDGSLDQSKITDHLKAIAFTAGFHFAFIEQGGTSLYPALAQRVTDPEVLRVVLSIGPTEAMHFQTWQDKAGNATPLTDTDPRTGSTVTFADLHDPQQPELFQANLIMPEPCPFLSRKFPKCSIVRPTKTRGAAMGAVKALRADGLFIGQSQAFFDLLRELAEEADATHPDEN